MAKPYKDTALESLELKPDAWPKFEKLIHSAAKMGHQPHKPPAEPAKKRASKPK